VQQSADGEVSIGQVRAHHSPSAERSGKCQPAGLTRRPSRAERGARRRERDPRADAKPGRSAWLCSWLHRHRSFASWYGPPSSCRSSRLLSCEALRHDDSEEISDLW